MDDILLASALVQGAFKLGLALCAVLLVRGTLLWLDRALGNKFGELLKVAEPTDQLRYYSWRYLATCILVGLVLL